MCGICGVVLAGREAPELREIVSAMTASLRHRGPDAMGVYVGEGWGVGHRRLSIIDIADGCQPMSDERGFTITYNGELYNYRELRSELEANGETFRTKSDTEVVLKAYAHWGDECLSKFNGMFAFAVFNSGRREVFLARDRIGIKPLYYAEIPIGGLAFGSEIKALLKSGVVGYETDLSMVPFYLVHGYFPREFTPFKNIRQLRPGHWLHWRDGRLASGCYWSVLAQGKGTHRVAVQDEEDLVHLIRDAVKKQAVSDVPIGVLLSGGIDSGIVTANLAMTGRELRTFTAVFPGESSIDEGLQAREVAARYGAQHHEVTVSPDDVRKLWEMLFDHFDQPFADDSALNSYLISKFVRDHVKVVMSGDGGDEQWGGYQNYRRYLQLASLRRLLPSRALGRAVTSSAGVAARILGTFRPRLGERVGFYSGLFSIDSDRMYDGLDGLVSPSLLEKLCGERVLPYLKNAGRYRPTADSNGDLGSIMLNDIQLFMVDDVLRKVDMTSMAVGLEVRVPLLDHRIVEKSLLLSWRDKVTKSDTKAFIRRLFGPELPPTVIRGKKKGFGLPLDGWLRGPLQESMQEILLSRACCQRGVLSASAIQAITDDHLSGRAQNGKLVFAMMGLERWLQRYDN